MTPGSAKARIDEQVDRSFSHLEANGTSESWLDEFVSFLRSPGTFRRSPLIIHCRFDDGALTHRIVVDNPHLNRRLSRQFLPFLDRVRERLRGRADVLVLLSDSVYIVESKRTQFIEYMRHVPFMRGDWLEGDPVSSSALAIPDFTLQDETYGNEVASIDRAASRQPFSSRVDLIKWRGRLTGPGYPDAENCHRFARYHLLRLGAERPDILDARLTHYDNFPDTPAGKMLQEHLNALLGSTEPEIPPAEFASYKYLISTDGVASSWKRVANSLRTGSVLLMQHRWSQFFYPGLAPWEHYVPISDDMSDLLARHAWLNAHPQQAERIGCQGRLFAESLLGVTAIEAHFASVLNRCATLPCAGLR